MFPILGRDLGQVQVLIKLSLLFVRGVVPDGAVQTIDVVPADPFERFPFNLADRFERTQTYHLTKLNLALIGAMFIFKSGQNCTELAELWLENRLNLGGLSFRQVVSITQKILPFLAPSCVQGRLGFMTPEEAFLLKPDQSNGALEM